MTTVAIQRTCGCGRAFTVTPAQDRAGHGQQCPVCKRAKRPVRPSQRPAPVSPRVDDLPLTDGGSHVLCAGCREPRPRGSFCARCEWRAAEMLSA